MGPAGGRVGCVCGLQSGNDRIENECGVAPCPSWDGFNITPNSGRSGGISYAEFDEFVLHFGTQASWPKASTMQTYGMMNIYKVLRGAEAARLRAVDGTG